MRQILEQIRVRVSYLSIDVPPDLAASWDLPTDLPRGLGPLQSRKSTGSWNLIIISKMGRTDGALKGTDGNLVGASTMKIPFILRKLSGRRRGIMRMLEL